MAVQLRRVKPFEAREAVVDFFWRIRIWPYSTKEQYLRLWDWRVRAFSESEPAVWIALDGAAVVGHIAVYFRNLSLNGQRVRAGTSAHLRIDADHYSAPLGGALGSAPRALVRSGEVDLLMGYGNPAAHRLVVASGSRDLGPMRAFIKVLRWAPLLRRKAAVLEPLAPLARVGVGAWNLLRRAHAPEFPRGLEARPVSADELARMSRSHWQTVEGLSWDGGLDYFANRFCTSEFNPCRVMAVTDVRNGRLEGVVAVCGTRQLRILQCATNEAAITPAQAVECVTAATPDADSVRIPLVPETGLAGEFLGAGYWPLAARPSEESIRDTRWSASWLNDHPLACELAQTQCWRLWYGWAHH